MLETDRIDAIAKELGVETSVADDIDYLRCMERRIVAAAKRHPHLRDFDVRNEALEAQLEALEK